MENELLQFGVTGIALLLIIKELFAFLKSRKSGMIEGNGNVNKQLLAAITTQNNNHLHTMQKTMDAVRVDINSGNDKLVSAIKDMHTDLAGKLGEVKGKLSR